MVPFTAEVELVVAGLTDVEFEAVEFEAEAVAFPWSSYPNGYPKADIN